MCTDAHSITLKCWSIFKLEYYTATGQIKHIPVYTYICVINCVIVNSVLHEQLLPAVA